MGIEIDVQTEATVTLNGLKPTDSNLLTSVGTLKMHGEYGIVSIADIKQLTSRANYYERSLAAIREFHAVVDYAITMQSDAVAFLTMWREGDKSGIAKEFPNFVYPSDCPF